METTLHTLTQFRELCVMTVCHEMKRIFNNIDNPIFNVESPK